MKKHLIKTLGGLFPADSAAAWYEKLKTGSIFSVEIKQVRNYQFHRKLFALLNLAYEYWEPGEVASDFGVPQKTFDRFRKDIIILAGFYDAEIRLDGSVRIVAKSISFASMDEETFSELYSKILTVIVEKISVLNTLEKNEVEKLVEKSLQFA